MSRRVFRTIVSALAAGLGSWLGAIATGTNGQAALPSDWQLVVAGITGLYNVLKDIQASLSSPPGRDL